MTGACRVDAAPELLGGRYRLVSWLGTGGMAEVFRARDLLLNRDVAVKVFHDHTLDDPLTLARARSETRLMARLSHRHLVTLYDASFPEPGTAPPRTGLRPPAYLVMELVAGPVLSAAIRGQQLELDEAARVGAGVAAALGHVHSAGVVHRDVKPANILLTGDGTAKLSDFGIALLGDDTRHTAAGLVVGTAGYLAPEQVRGGNASSASDVHALGLVLLECLTGCREYPGTGVQSAVARLQRPPVIPADLPRDWQRLLSELTGDDPGQRPSAVAAAARLQALVNGQRTVTLPGVASHPRRSGWAVLAAAAVVVVAMLGGLAALTSGGAGPQPVVSTRSAEPVATGQLPPSTAAAPIPIPADSVQPPVSVQPPAPVQATDQPIQPPVPVGAGDPPVVPAPVQAPARRTPVEAVPPPVVTAASPAPPSRRPAAAVQTTQPTAPRQPVAPTNRGESGNSNGKGHDNGSGRGGGDG